MGSDVLKEVIAAEAEIQRSIEAEREAAREKLGKIRRETEEEVEREKERIKESYALTLEETEKDAEGKASGVVAEASERAEIIKRLGGEAVREAVLRHIIRILPGDGRDSQDVEG